MARKRWEIRTSTPEILLDREKRKWQITLRRYLIDKSPCPQYAPAFGLDIQTLRDWISNQFTPILDWGNFGVSWQLGHLLPVACFDPGSKADWELCWNFLNLRVDPIEDKRKVVSRYDVSTAKTFFEEIYAANQYPKAAALIDKAEQLLRSSVIPSGAAVNFMKSRDSYLKKISGYDQMEFELLNQGLNPEEVEREMSFIKKNIQS